MSRLTKVYGNGNITLDASQFPPIDQNTLDSEINNSKPVKAAVAKLADIEDVEENGLLVRLPCKVGDTVYLSDGRKATVTSFFHYKNISQGNCWLTVKCNGRRNNEKRLCLSISEFGKTVFLTHEEAMQALKARDSK